MAIIIKTNNPSGLLAAIKKAIDEESIKTWAYDNEGDFTHTADQWIKRDWLRPQIYDDQLRFGILFPEKVKMTPLIYGIYHGRFIEMLTTHLNSKFSFAAATSKKAEPDDFD